MPQSNQKDPKDEFAGMSERELEILAIQETRKTRRAVRENSTEGRKAHGDIQNLCRLIIKMLGIIIFLLLGLAAYLADKAIVFHG